MTKYEITVSFHEVSDKSAATKPTIMNKRVVACSDDPITAEIMFLICVEKCEIACS